jgi:hypothetical protein
MAHSHVSLEHQHLAKRYVVRGLESGGAVEILGNTSLHHFTQGDGQPIEWLHPVEAIGVNGVHAVVVAPVLARIEMLRKDWTYELLITQHRPAKASDLRWRQKFCFEEFTGGWSWTCRERTVPPQRTVPGSLTVPVRGIRSDRLGIPSLPFCKASDHVLCGRPLEGRIFLLSRNNCLSPMGVLLRVLRSLPPLSA